MSVENKRKRKVRASHDHCSIISNNYHSMMTSHQVSKAFNYYSLVILKSSGNKESSNKKQKVIPGSQYRSQVHGVINCKQSFKVICTESTWGYEEKR